MCKIRSLTINNYRGIHSLEIKDLKRINVLLGNNNSSKSSVLEAINILMGANEPSLPIQMNMERSYKGLNQSDFAAFFHNMATDKAIDIHAILDNKADLKLSIRYKKERIAEFIPEKIKGIPSTPLSNWGLEYHYNDNGNIHNSSIIYDIEDEKLKIRGDWNETDSRKALLLAPRYDFNEFISHFNQIVTDKEKSYVLKALKNIEPRISDIVVVGNQVMVDAGLAKLIPINLMGDGTRKLFTIITAMYNAKNGIILIDEIDNGLYYKSMKTLWKAVLTMATTFDIQVFVSTHSIDSLNALSELLDKEEVVLQNDVNVITLRKYEEDNITAYNYLFEDFNYLLKREEEIR